MHAALTLYLRAIWSMTSTQYFCMIVKVDGLGQLFWTSADTLLTHEASSYWLPTTATAAGRPVAHNRSKKNRLVFLGVHAATSIGYGVIWNKFTESDYRWLCLESQILSLFFHYTYCWVIQHPSSTAVKIDVC
jgi:hypothetical protein